MGIGFAEGLNPTLSTGIELTVSIDLMVCVALGIDMVRYRYLWIPSGSSGHRQIACIQHARRDSGLR